MGNEQSAQQPSPLKPSQISAANSTAPKNVPYTTFSVDKSQQLQPQPSQQPQKKPVSQESVNNNSTDNIITVKSAVNTNPSNVPPTDEVMEQLQSLPQFYPLIKDSIDQSLWRDIFSNSKYSSLQDLDALDSKMLLEICAEFQTYAMNQSRNVCARQDVIIKQIRNCQFKSNQALADLSQKSEKLKKMATSLREVERLSKYVVDCKKSVDSIVEEIQTLEQLLPQQVVKQVQTPLFSMVKEQQQQQQQQQSSVALETSG